MAVTLYQSLDTCLSEPLTIVNLRSIITLLTRAHYSDPANFGILEEELECLALDPEAEDNDLNILLDFIPDKKKPSPRPAIWINFERCQFDKKAIDNKAGGSEDNSRTEYVKIEDVSFTLTHVHDSVDIALMMAETTCDFFAGIRPHLMGKLGLSFFEVENIIKPRQSERAPERYYEVDVGLRMMFSFVMSANIESHRLKKFALELQGE